MEDKYLHLFLEETSLYNNIVLGHLLPSSWWVSLPRFCQAWLRNYIAGSLLYLTTGFLCSFYVYYLKRNVNLPKGIYEISYSDYLAVQLLKFETFFLSKIYYHMKFYCSHFLIYFCFSISVFLFTCLFLDLC